MMPRVHDGRSQSSSAPTRVIRYQRTSEVTEFVERKPRPCQGASPNRDSGTLTEGLKVDKSGDTGYRMKIQNVNHQKNAPYNRGNEG